MIQEKPLFRRRLKAAFRLALQSTLRIPCPGVYGIPFVLLARLQKNVPLYVVDVGAHDGDITFGLACYCGLEAAVLVEPLPHKAAKLREKFRPPHYHVFECALAAAPGEAELRVNEMEATSSLFSIRRDMPELNALPLGQERVVRVAQRTLDSVIAEANLPRIDVLKIDVQGAEHLVLSGAAETLRRTRIIWTECSFKPLYEGSSTFTDIYTTLDAAGFRLLEMSPAFRSPSGELLQSDLLFVNSKFAQ